MNGYPNAERRIPILLLCLTASLSSCLTPPREAVTLASPKIPSVAIVGVRKTVAVARPQDERPDPASIGKWSQGYVHETVATNTNVAVWVGDAVVASFGRVGFRVERTESISTAPNVVAVGISVTDAEAQFGTVGFSTSHGEARVVARFEIFSGGRTVFKRTFAGSSTVDTDSPTADKYGELLGQALSEMLRDAMPALVATVSREGSESWN